MLDLSWGEMALIAAVALIVIGPKDLPQVLRTVGRWTAAARNMAREFQGHVDEMIRESEVDKIRQEIRENTVLDLQELQNTIDPNREIRDALDPAKLEAAAEAKVVPPPPVPAAPGPGGAYEPPAPEAPPASAAQPAPATGEPTRLTEPEAVPAKPAAG